jgi:pyruvate,water dikinase
VQLARLARSAAKGLGGPQDIEWAIDHAAHLLLFQSRPVTAVGIAADASGPLLGPGPIAETFPEPLRRLERQLLLEPLREGIVRAFGVLGSVSTRRLAHSPVVTHVGGRVAADLEIFGVAPVRRSPGRYLNPAPPVRHLAAAWRIGRLRRTLPAIAAGLAATVDQQLLDVPALGALSDRELLWTIATTRRQLAAVHGYEVLAGTLLRPDEGGPTAAGLAIAAIETGRARGLSDARIVASMPDVLAVVPPGVPPRASLPALAPAGRPGSSSAAVEGSLGPREMLRVRSRWLQELISRSATELGRRLARGGRLPSARSVRELTLAELSGLVSGDRPPSDLEARLAEPDAPPLPAAFRLSAAGVVAPVRPPRGRHPRGGLGAGGGRAVGRVRQLSDDAVAERGDVLVVRVLEPALAVALPRLGGLVAETGGTLSHLAILARESHVPTVVGVEDALDRFRTGTLVLVDGTTGEVRSIEEGAP